MRNEIAMLAHDSLFPSLSWYLVLAPVGVAICVAISRRDEPWDGIFSR
jgi:hypothetical protein